MSKGLGYLLLLSLNAKRRFSSYICVTLAAAKRRQLTVSPFSEKDRNKEKRERRIQIRVDSTEIGWVFPVAHLK
jgi:hypothetical protein